MSLLNLCCLGTCYCVRVVCEAQIRRKVPYSRDAAASKSGASTHEYKECDDMVQMVSPMTVSNLPKEIVTPKFRFSGLKTVNNVFSKNASLLSD